MHIAVDWGFGFTKAMSEEEGKRISFPSVVTPLIRRTDMDMLSSKEDYHITVQNGNARDLAVGNLALLYNGTRAWEDDYVKNQNLVYLLSLAVALLNKSVKPVNLIAGLPMAYYRHQQNMIKEMLKDLKMEVHVNGAGGRIVNIKEIEVLPQAAGVFYSQLLTPEGKIKDPSLLQQATGIVDIGYRTTDLLVMDKGSKGLIPRQDLMGGLDVGVSNSMQELKKTIDESARDDIPLAHIEKSIAFYNGVLTYKGQKYDLNKYKEETHASMAEKIAEEVKLMWGKELNNLPAVIIGGGGGKELYPYLQNHIPQAWLAEDAFFANTKGFLAVVRSRE